MQTYLQKAEIVRTEKLADDIFRFTLKSPDIAAACRPGQFIMVRTTAGMDPLLRRPFSVHRIAAGGLLQILFKVIGRGTRLLADLQSGIQLDILGPLGCGFVYGNHVNHCLVGGGIGIAPLLFLAEQLLKKNEPAAVAVFLGARTGDEVAALAEDFTSMGLAVQVATEDGSLGRQGLVTDLMAPANNGNQGMVYACGPYPMLRAVTALCRKREQACQVSLEALMACGLAACLGCAVPRADLKGYVHVCKDGPVFNGDDVAWV